MKKGQEEEEITGWSSPEEYKFAKEYLECFFDVLYAEKEIAPKQER